MSSGKSVFFIVCTKPTLGMGCLLEDNPKQTLGMGCLFEDNPKQTLPRRQANDLKNIH
jgi:hypothetical protein